MTKFYITFGQKYRHEKHPLFVDQPNMRVHPDGYWVVHAKDQNEAINKVWDSLDCYWAGIYSKKPNKEMFPLGVIGKIK